METVWITAIIQGGAMGILAYHFLVNLPALVKEMATMQRDDRIFFASESAKDRETFQARSDRLANEIKSLREYFQHNDLVNKSQQEMMSHTHG